MVPARRAAGGRHEPGQQGPGQPEQALAIFEAIGAVDSARTVRENLEYLEAEAAGRDQATPDVALALPQPPALDAPVGPALPVEPPASGPEAAPETLADVAQPAAAPVRRKRGWWPFGR